MSSNLPMFINKLYKQAFFAFLAAIQMLAISCQSPSQEGRRSAADQSDIKESLIKANRFLIRSEEEDIADFLQRYGWKMEKSGTGLRYLIESTHKGQTAHYGQRVSLKYKVMLLTGDVIYDSDQFGLKDFIVGRGGVETGLEEGILLLRKGDQAKFILPSHLAFGLLGDSEKIPPRTPIVYILEVIDIQ